MGKHEHKILLDFIPIYEKFKPVNNCFIMINSEKTVYVIL